MNAKAKGLAERFGANIASVVAARPAAPAGPPEAVQPDRYEGATRSRQFGELPISAIHRDPSQPREEFEPGRLAQLADSIRRYGQLSPIRVRRDEAAGRWLILVGERRARACELAGLGRVRVEFVERAMTEADVLAEQVIENVARADLRPVEEGRAYRRLMDLNGWGVEQLAEGMGIQVTTAHHRLGLLRLPDDVAELVDAGEIKATAAYEISKLQIAEDQREVARQVVAGGLDYKATAAEVARRKRPAGGKGRGGARPTKVVERTLKTPAGPKVTIAIRKGLDAALIRAALLEAVAAIDAESATAEAA